MVIWLIPLSAMLAAATAELLQRRRMRRLRHLAFGPEGRPRVWVRAVPAARVLAVGLLSWAFLTLFHLNPIPSNTQNEEEAPDHHLVIALDVSPSMQLKDSGQGRKQTRAERSRDLLQSIMSRIDFVRTRVSVVAFYTEAKPVVIETIDPEVVRNILDDLPLEHAFAAGKTNMYLGVEKACEIAKDWLPGTATLLVVSDGDTLPDKGLPPLPPSIENVLVLGVGDLHRGLFIDGHSSRQNGEALNRLALRLTGVYHDGNERHVSTALLQEFSQALRVRERGGLSMRGWALLALAMGGALLALLSPALALFGSAFGRAANAAGQSVITSGRLPGRTPLEMGAEL